MTHPGASHDYAARVARHIPGLQDMHRMVGLLLAERAAAGGRMLVLGAGGGLELKTLAEAQPGWRFDGVDPSAPMLAQARETLGDHAARVTLHEGYIDDAPDGPFDGACCLLTLHFLPEAERQRTVSEMVRRLKPGAALVVMHHSYMRAEQDIWLSRYAAFMTAKGAIAPDMQAMKERLPVLPPAQDAAILQAAGLRDVVQFYQALTFRGWVGVKR